MPVVIDKTLHVHTRLAAWDINETEADLQSRLKLNDAERRYLASIVAENKRLQWLASRCLIRIIMNTPEFIGMHTTNSGQPMISNSTKKVSISHAGNYAAVIMSDTFDVGIDVEEIAPKVLRIKDKFLSVYELAWLKDSKLESYLLAWSAKEALFKWYGKGNVDFRKHLILEHFSVADKGFIRGMFKNDYVERELEIHYEFFSNCVLTWIEG